MLCIPKCRFILDRIDHFLSKHNPVSSFFVRIVRDLLLFLLVYKVLFEDITSGQTLAEPVTFSACKRTRTASNAQTSREDYLAFEERIVHMETKVWGGLGRFDAFSFSL